MILSVFISKYRFVYKYKFDSLRVSFIYYLFFISTTTIYKREGDYKNKT